MPACHRELHGVSSLLLPLHMGPGIKLRPSGLRSRPLYPLTHIADLQGSFCTRETSITGWRAKSPMDMRSQREKEAPSSLFCGCKGLCHPMHHRTKKTREGRKDPSTALAPPEFQRRLSRALQSSTQPPRGVSETSAACWALLSLK